MAKEADRGKDKVEQELAKDQTVGQVQAIIETSIGIRRSGAHVHTGTCSRSNCFAFSYRPYHRHKGSRPTAGEHPEAPAKTTPERLGDQRAAFAHSGICVRMGVGQHKGGSMATSQP